MWNFLCSLIVVHSFSIQETNDDAPYGTVLGSNNGVKGFSNNRTPSDEISYMFIGDVKTGLKYQCVEYARRWIYLQYGQVFRDIPCASDIWHLSSLVIVGKSQEVQLNRIPNGSLCKPLVGSLLIYKKVEESNPVGHVAIITDVFEDFIHVAEQNWDCNYWPGDYSRKIRLMVRNNRYFIIDELPILGWMNTRTNQPECVDPACKTCTELDEKGFCDYF